MGLHDRINNKGGGAATLDPLAAVQPTHEQAAETRNGGGATLVLRLPCRGPVEVS